MRRMLLATLVAGLGFAGCTQDEAGAPDVLRIALQDEVKTLDPAKAYDAMSLDVLPSIMEPLLQYKYLEDSLVLEPLLAESLPEYSKDGLTVTVKIRKGVYFHDDPCFRENGGKGRELKASDFVFAFKRLALPGIRSQGSWIFEDKVLGFNEFQKKLHEAGSNELKAVFEEPVPGFMAKDDRTLEIRLTHPYPRLNSVLAMTFTVPVAREAVQAYSDREGNLKDHPVGTGPFFLKSWESGQRVVLARNPAYFETFPTMASDGLKTRGFLADAGKRLPLVDGLSFEIMKEESSRLSKFEKGEVDTVELSKETFRAFMADPEHPRADVARKGIQVDKEDSLVFYSVIFNVKDKFLSNKKLRQAISSALNRVQWMEMFEYQRSSIQDQMSPPGLVDRLEGAKLKFDFNLERAKALLVEAGYPAGKGLPLLNFDFRGADARYRQMGEMFVQQLGAIGIRINPVLNAFPEYLEKAKQGDFQIALGGWTYDYPDVENGYQLLYGPNRSPGPNISRWENMAFDSLYRKISALPGGAPGRSALVKEAENQIQEEVPWAYGYFLKVFRLAQKRVKNFRVAEVIQNKYKYMRIENERAKKD